MKTKYQSIWRNSSAIEALASSDAHIVSHIGRCGTRFEQPISNEQDLVQALQQGAFEAVKIQAADA